MFSRHGFGIAWVSDRLRNTPHEKLDGGPSDNWELGTRDTGAYATMSDVKEYMCWLGKEFTKNKKISSSFSIVIIFNILLLSLIILYD